VVNWYNWQEISVKYVTNDKKICKTVKCVKMVKYAKEAYAMISLRAYFICMKGRISTVDPLIMTGSHKLLLIL
jgi:hypothetical protein